MVKTSIRAKHLQPSFIREILKITQSPEIISFAGGLPNPNLFPITELVDAATIVFKNQAKEALQYTITAGYPPLRDWIVKRYYADNSEITADNIIITTGSQQAIDLLGKLFIDPGDAVIVEDPSYLGALQSLSVYEPQFKSITLTETGIDLEEMTQTINKSHPKLAYTVPNFQNPTGISYNQATRINLAKLITNTNTLLIEDDPYHDLYFQKKSLSTIKSLAPDQVFHLGSFSKSIAPGFRLGWVCSPKAYIQKLTILKEASDLHSDHVSQRIIFEYLNNGNFDIHLDKIRSTYNRNKNVMISAIKSNFPSSITFTKPIGGMFIWLTLPNNMSTSALFKEVIKYKVAFVPGKYFFSKQDHDDCLRLNFSNTSQKNIDQGIRILGRIATSNVF